MNHITNICLECVRDEGASIENNYWVNNGYCDMCKKNTSVSKVRDWNWPRNHPLNNCHLR